MQRPVTRRGFLLATGAGVTSLAGCVGGGGSNDPQVPATDSRTDGTGRGPPTSDHRLPIPMEPSSLRERAVSGGPGKDGIPAIEDPSFVSASEASRRLDPGDPVFGLANGDDARAYPQSILVLHEVCNDTVGGTPVSVTYCPLTGTAMGFERGETTFGVSGRLVNNNLIMYDRATETWWPQVLATAIPGPWNRDPDVRSLREFRVVWTTWERWSTAYPETRVLSRDTGFARNYDRDPYGSYNPRRGYYSPDSSPMFPALFEDDRLQPKTVVIGARTASGAVAVEKDTLRNAKIVQCHVDGTPVVAVYDDELDTGYVYRNPDEAAFEYRSGQVVDETGETNAPSSLDLDEILAFDAMWFAWSGFYPDTRVHD